MLTKPLGTIKMDKQIKEIWIESEDNGAIIGGKLETNDNSDVIVTFTNDSRAIATFFTYQNIEFLRIKNKETGECLSGRFFWASDMIIVDKINRQEVEEIIYHLISEDEFDLIFKKKIKDFDAFIINKAQNYHIINLIISQFCMQIVCK